VFQKVALKFSLANNLKHTLLS